MKLLCISCLLILSFAANSQKLLRGVVIDEANKLPVNKATVFINRTSIGTTTNERGEFALRIPFGRHALIGIAPGFETYGQFIDPDEVSDSLVIYLKKETAKKNMEEYEKAGWDKWGDYFLSNFLGIPTDGQYKIKNTRALKFQVAAETGDLFATSEEPLVIENKMLGYIILYKLESFHSNFKTLVVSYNGYSFFQPMNGNTSQQQDWERKRSQAYFGSLMHFMRSIYRNQIEEEGFDVRPLTKVLSLSAKTNLADSNNLRQVKVTDSLQKGDTDGIPDQILNPDNYKDVIGSPLPGDSIAYAIDSTTAGLYFDNFLLVNYRGTSSSDVQNEETYKMSQLVLINKKPLEIEADGSFYDYRDLMVIGYWMWAQKVAFLLPFDYVPPKSK